MRKKLKYVFRYLDWKGIFLLFLGILGYSLEALVLPLFIKYFLDALVNYDLVRVFIVSLIYIGLQLLIHLAGYLWKWKQQLLINNLMLNEKKRLTYSYMQDVSLKQYIVEDLIINVLPLIETRFIDPFFKFSYSFLFILISLIYALICNWMLALAFILLVVIRIILKRKILKQKDNYEEVYEVDFGKYFKTVNDYFNGRDAIRNHLATDRLLVNLFHLLEKSENSYLELHDKLHQINFITKFLNILAELLPLVFGAYLYFNNYLDLVNLMVSYLIFIRLNPSLKKLNNYYLQFRKGEKFVERLLDLKANEDANESLPLEEGILPLKLEDSAIKLHEELFIEPFSMDVYQGDHLLILGGEDFERSLILKLIHGDIYNEDIKLSYKQMDRARINIYDIYKRVAYFHKFDYLFNDSIAFNITLGKECEKSSIEEVVRKVGLSYLIDESRLYQEEDNLEEKLSENEKLRLYLARLLLQGYELILVDEFGSELEKKDIDEIKAIIHREFATVVEVSAKAPTKVDVYNKFYRLEGSKLSAIEVVEPINVSTYIY